MLINVLIDTLIKISTNIMLFCIQNKEFSLNIYINMLEYCNNFAFLIQLFNCILRK